MVRRGLLNSEGGKKSTVAKLYPTPRRRGYLRENQDPTRNLLVKHGVTVGSRTLDHRPPGYADRRQAVTKR